MRRWRGLTAAGLALRERSSAESDPAPVFPMTIPLNPAAPVLVALDEQEMAWMRLFWAMRDQQRGRDGRARGRLG